MVAEQAKLNYIAGNRDDFILQTFGETNYDKWRFRMKLFFEMKNCYDVIQHINLKLTIVISVLTNITNNIRNNYKDMIEKFDETYLPKRSAIKLL
ncbi:hypothetical protein PR048_021056 [Dryococelus australis]|uniref:Uncharacterized protein n=1 Tax=Dryococelus australis TaxID=614101 RepID=A0ABQ9GX64_9NEOP|nr:hypothetical protein PR048_021056 [Dryococelus australis]